MKQNIKYIYILFTCLAVLVIIGAALAYTGYFQPQELTPGAKDGTEMKVQEHDIEMSEPKEPVAEVTIPNNTISLPKFDGSITVKPVKSSSLSFTTTNTLNNLENNICLDATPSLLLPEDIHIYTASQSPLSTPVLTIDHEELPNRDIQEISSFKSFLENPNQKDFENIPLNNDCSKIPKLLIAQIDSESSIGFENEVSFYAVEGQDTLGSISVYTYAMQDGYIFKMKNDVGAQFRDSYSDCVNSTSNPTFRDAGSIECVQNRLTQNQELQTEINNKMMELQVLFAFK